MSSLIIGAAGFVGAYLIDQLADKCKDKVFATRLEHEKPVSCKAEDICLDILDYDKVCSVISKVRPQYIYHLAAQSSVKLSWSKPQLTADVNIKGTINVLEAVRTLDYKPRVLLVGSGEEYGYLNADEIPVKEDTVLRAGNIYAATKACQGMLGSIYARAYGMDIIMVRAFNHIGPGQSDIFVISDFCRQTAAIECGKHRAEIKVGNLSAERDFTDVRDIVRAYSELMKKGKSGEIYNVGSGRAVSIKHMLDKILLLSDAEIKVITDESRMRPSDVPVIAADISKLKSDTGWSPEIPIEQTIKDILDYWRVRENAE